MYVVILEEMYQVVSVSVMVDHQRHRAAVIVGRASILWLCVWMCYSSYYIKCKCLSINIFTLLAVVYSLSMRSTKSHNKTKQYGPMIIIKKSIILLSKRNIQRILCTVFILQCSKQSNLLRKIWILLVNSRLRFSWI